MDARINKILLVDDDPNILMSLEFLMRKNGYDVLVARNGTEALELLNENIPDLTLLDIMMPDVDGYEICRHIKSSKKLRHSKVVFLSAKTKESDVKKGYTLGADLYVTKPFSTKELVRKVEELLS
jgi:DNA-binding response OmpR family regulator